MNAAEFNRIVRERGKSLQEIGSPEIALSRADTLRAIASLQNSDQAILGGQVVRFGSDGPSYELTGIWTAPRFDSKQSWDSFVSATHELAKDYVTNYLDPELPEPYFALNIMDKQHFRDLPATKG